MKNPAHAFGLSAKERAERFWPNLDRPDANLIALLETHGRDERLKLFRELIEEAKAGKWADMTSRDIVVWLAETRGLSRADLEEIEGLPSGAVVVGKKVGNG